MPCSSPLSPLKDNFVHHIVPISWPVSVLHILLFIYTLLALVVVNKTQFSYFIRSCIKWSVPPNKLVQNAAAAPPGWNEGEEEVS